jgi:hypothetical protein
LLLYYYFPVAKYIAFHSQEHDRKKNVFICKSTRMVSPIVLGYAVGADSVLYKAMGNGFLFLIRFEKKDKKRGGQRHSFMENKIAEMDKLLQGPMENTSTWFESIGVEEHETKVRSFSKEGRLDDHLYREIYDVHSLKVNGHHRVKAGVQKWKWSASVKAVDGTRVEEDVQETVITVEPGGGKKMVDDRQRLLVKQTADMDRLGEELRTRTLELEEMRKELVTLRLGASKAKEAEEWYFVKQLELDRERRRLGRVLAGLELPGMEEAVAAFREEIARVKAESEANVAGLVSIKERDARIAALEEENVKLTQRLENANRAAGEADSKVSIMEDVVAGCGVARKEIRKRTSGVYTGLDDLWEGTPSFFNEAVGEIVEKKEEGEKKKTKKKVEKVVTFSVR